jgi:hypothetical protein
MRTTDGSAEGEEEDLAYGGAAGLDDDDEEEISMGTFVREITCIVSVRYGFGNHYGTHVLRILVFSVLLFLSRVQLLLRSP